MTGANITGSEYHGRYCSGRGVYRWHEIISRLLELGLSQREIAQRVGSSPMTIHRLIEDPNREPIFRLGVRLLALLVTAETDAGSSLSTDSDQG